MDLSASELDIARGSRGERVAWALKSQAAVGRFFDAVDFVEISQAHITADYEVMGEAGLRILSELAADGVRVAVPTTRNSRSVCPALATRFRQDPILVAAEAKIGDLLTTIGVDAANTCVPYEAAYTPAFGERVAWGDTGAAAYANGVLGARTNFEGGAAGLWAALTGRTPRFGFHLDDARLANAVVSVSAPLTSTTDWAVLGALIGEQLRGYDRVPLIDVGDRRPSADALKGLAAALASYGSIAMFHIPGVTPESPSRETADEPSFHESIRIDQSDLGAYYRRWTSSGDVPTLVVFSAPQLSVEELTDLAELTAGRSFLAGVTVIVTTSPLTKTTLESTAVAALEAAGATVIDGTCWYLMDPSAMRDAFGWQTVLTNSPKLANILPASGYTAMVRPTEVCVEAAITGRLA